MEEKGWDKLRELLPKGFVWGWQGATREGKRGRAMGGLVMGVRKNLVGGQVAVEAKGEGIIVGRVRIGEKRWKVIGVYVGKRGIEETLREIDEWIRGEGEGEKTIVGGDFNARTGRERGGITVKEGEGWEEEEVRRSKDEKMNREGRVLVEFLEERGWMIYNGAIRGDEEGEFTFTGGKGDTVIDYVVGNREVKEGIKRMRIGDRVDSDHQPVEVTLRGERRRMRIEKGSGEGYGIRKDGRSLEKKWER